MARVTVENCVDKVPNRFELVLLAMRAEASKQAGGDLLFANRVIPVAPAASAREWATILIKYREPNHARSVLELLVTASGFAVLWFMAWAVLGVSSWLSLLTALLAGGFLVRLFMIQHDCGHGAFLRHRASNDWLGRV